ncbi:MAG: V-type ATP synthase subunit E [Ruminococcus sp.]|nr:V-type ATP synthase subunit E [Ruminococcus sp.]
MAGIENILGIISSQQKQTENNIISVAEKRADVVIADGNEKAEKEYSEYRKKSEKQLALDYDNAVSSVDAEMRRNILACKIHCIDAVIEKTLERLDIMPADEYFDILEKLLVQRADKSKGLLYLSQRDLSRITDDFEKAVKNLNIKISENPADIENGFILTYGLISENCSFRAIIEAERDSIRDMAADALFGQVKK